ncbi:MAG TPA: hypothetical protein VJB98_02060 [Candidatus Paceibacterota bacterium]
MDENNVNSSVGSMGWFKTLVMIVLLALLVFLVVYFGKFGGGDDTYQAASIPAENQGVVTDEEREAIDSARYAVPTEEVQ